MVFVRFETSCHHPKLWWTRGVGTALATAETMPPSRVLRGRKDRERPAVYPAVPSRAENVLDWPSFVNERSRAIISALPLSPRWRVLQYSRTRSTFGVALVIKHRQARMERRKARVVVGNWSKVISYRQRAHLKLWHPHAAAVVRTPKKSHRRVGDFARTIIHRSNQQYFQSADARGEL